MIAPETQPLVEPDPDHALIEFTLDEEERRQRAVDALELEHRLDNAEKTLAQMTKKAKGEIAKLKAELQEKKTAHYEGKEERRIRLIRRPNVAKNTMDFIREDTRTVHYSRQLRPEERNDPGLFAEEQRAVEFMGSGVPASVVAATPRADEDDAGEREAKTKKRGRNGGAGG